jgi:hypothetical protein
MFLILAPLQRAAHVNSINGQLRQIHGKCDGLGQIPVQLWLKICKIMAMDAVHQGFGRVNRLLTPAG